MRQKLSIVFLTTICVSAALAWITSYPAARYLPSQPTNGGWRVRSTAGQLEVYRYAPPAPGLLPLNDSRMNFQPTAWSGRRIDDPHVFGQIVFERGVYWTANSTTTHVAVRIHYALLLLIAGGLLIVQSIRAWQAHLGQRARDRGLCTVCGYDLRATPDRCPECGTIPAKSPDAAVEIQRG